MAPLALSGGDTALIILAAFWGLLVLFLCVVLLNTFRVLESTKMMIDATREETVPLLREVRGSVERTNREIDRIDGILERVDRLSGLIEQAAASPLVKIISVGAGLRKGASRFKKQQTPGVAAGLGRRRVPSRVLGRARARRRGDRGHPRLPMDQEAGHARGARHARA